MHFDGKTILVTGGTGSLGQRVVRRLLSGDQGRPRRVIVFSRDEAKQHYMRLSYLHKEAATDEVIYRNSQEILSFRIGDVRDYPSLLRAAREADVIIHAAALKQVPSCEYFPFEAVQTNVHGAQNVVRVIRENHTPVKTVVGISTDKACKPINVMGMTKAVMERILVEANLESPQARFVCVRYGNVVASRGSVVPLFLSQIERGGPVTITMADMTRFLLTLDRAVDTVFAAVGNALPGETYVPKVPAARVVDIANALIGDADIKQVFTGIRPGEKIHEIMVSEEECYRTIERGDYYVIRPMLPELRKEPHSAPALRGEYSSSDVTLDHHGLRRLLDPYITGAEAIYA
ncbi:MAG TPA: polysaccharide biosynthesis protein [Thermoanaerobaculia bacterium]|nr:polysaccharide biosynthesis protein [Thermoanaerobaculia bacterium]